MEITYSVIYGNINERNFIALFDLQEREYYCYVGIEDVQIVHTEPFVVCKDVEKLQLTLFNCLGYDSKTKKQILQSIINSLQKINFDLYVYYSKFENPTQNILMCYEKIKNANIRNKQETDKKIEAILKRWETVMK